MVSATKEESGVTYFQYASMDHRGSIAKLTDENGNITHSYLYNAWGQPLESTTNGVSNRQTYQSNWIELEDSNGGFLISPARVYSSKVGRFVQRDAAPDIFTAKKHLGIYETSIFSSVLTFENMEANRTFSDNLYISFMDSPLSYVDPEGELAWFIPALIIGLASISLTGDTPQADAPKEIPLPLEAAVTLATAHVLATSAVASKIAEKVSKGSETLKEAKEALDAVVDAIHDPSLVNIKNLITEGADVLPIPKVFQFSKKSKGDKGKEPPKPKTKKEPKNKCEEEESDLDRMRKKLGIKEGENKGPKKGEEATVVGIDSKKNELEEIKKKKKKSEKKDKDGNCSKGDQICRSRITMAITICLNHRINLCAKVRPRAHILDPKRDCSGRYLNYFKSLCDEAHKACVNDKNKNYILPSFKCKSDDEEQQKKIDRDCKCIDPSTVSPDDGGRGMKKASGFF